MTGNRPIGGTFEDVGETINQSVVTPVVDEIGKAIETGIQSVVGTPAQTAQQKQQKADEDQQKMAGWRWRLQKIKELKDAQKKDREEKAQKELQAKQQEEQSEKEETQIDQFEIVKKSREVNPEAKGKIEIKRGVGG
ncbi:hypothetical protein A3F00_04510 [Candidatus Daviesbacteria bacterium RIFCSPHIGHO2_12_FULL_37_11]|uniref:Uncharacterized protein n=1 Tax=Candidatus Daviesbacteria bacterium RIFCSPHIGHO2_12_FULL_37_11 TaxID=1797777 RepID=A0A1F5K9V2_9BACT|nr:MAG: hypothetical protein A2769_03680 [Candidatus Daviesbacteria bacterium RIFCSPHIGHO2_01_FULL_37_27]OGE37686.1 MAG: hypothetical protein A3F00_04510 [Candidatus Daviesbacteria bacterium RIFCSPHIGHO2_12_FULL_37_11]OGE45441.1 MAG: hypothetical protein A3B39_04910 [Candidatus Daviesbacteria bacterium RIFCSPLOWO2_01_FULL_37_10]